MHPEIEVLGWADYDGNRFEGDPGDPADIWGMFVHVHNPETGEDQHFWAYLPMGLDFDWDEWYDYIEQLSDMYGQAAA